MLFFLIAQSQASDTIGFSKVQVRKVRIVKMDGRKARPSGKVKVGGKTYLRYSLATASPYENGFYVDRMYLILKFVRGDLTVRFTTDVAPLTGLAGETAKKSAYTVYLKHAYVQWKAVESDKRSLNLRFGVIPTVWTGLEERFWGHRFVEKSTYDLAKLEYTADMGVSFTYRCKVLPWEINAGIYNGNGYKELESDPHKDVMGRISLYPTALFGLNDLLGIHAFAHTTTEGLGFKDRYIGGLSLQTSPLTLMLTHAYYTTDYRTYAKGGSLFAVLRPFGESFGVFGRYDLLGDYTDRFAVVGLSARPQKHLRVALSYKWREGTSPTVSLHTEAKF